MRLPSKFGVAVDGRFHILTVPSREAEKAKVGEGKLTARTYSGEEELAGGDLGRISGGNGAIHQPRGQEAAPKA